MIGITLKRYLKSPVTAPKGFYYIGSIYRGSADFRMERVDSFVNDFNGQGSVFRNIQLTNVGFIRYGAGIGKQWIFQSRFLLDLTFLVEGKDYYAEPYWDELNDFPSPIVNLGINLGIAALLF